MSGGRWMRLDVAWSSSEWLYDLPVGARLAWIELLGHVKGTGLSGTAKALAPNVAARMWRIDESDVRTMIDAAITHGAIELIDANVSITQWEKYQGDPSAADRSKRYREGMSRLSPSRSVTPVTRDDRESRDVTPTGEERRGEVQEKASSELVAFPQETSVVSAAKTPRKRRTHVRREYSSDFEAAWAIHPRGSKAKAADRYRDAVPEAISHEDLTRYLTEYVQAFGPDFEGAHLERWIRDARWEEQQARASTIRREPVDPKAFRVTERDISEARTAREIAQRQEAEAIARLTAEGQTLAFDLGSLVASKRMGSA